MRSYFVQYRRRRHNGICESVFQDEDCDKKRKTRHNTRTLRNDGAFGEFSAQSASSDNISRQRHKPEQGQKTVTDVDAAVGFQHIRVKEKC